MFTIKIYEKDGSYTSHSCRAYRVEVRHGEQMLYLAPLMTSQETLTESWLAITVRETAFIENALGKTVDRVYCKPDTSGCASGSLSSKPVVTA